MGYLPAALRNYLVRLGWSQGDKEFFTTEELIAAFDLPSIGRSPSRFDFAKLENMNGHFMRATSDDELFDDAHRRPALSARRAGDRGQARRARSARSLRAAIPGLKERAKTLVELLDGAGFLFADAAAGDGREGGGHPRSAAAARISRRCCRSSRRSPSGPRPAPRRSVRAYAEAEGAKLGAIAQPLRAALTGRSTSPGIFDVLAVLGREESLGRIEDQATL